MTDLTESDRTQRRTLLAVLALNGMLAVVLGVGGLAADSSALLANAVDNASDAAVYLIGFLAVGRSPRLKERAATASGVMLLIFAAGVLADVVRRGFTGAEPFGPTMMVLALVAAAVNLWCLRLLKKTRSDDVNMRAAETFSFNDFFSNGGIIVAGLLVLWLDQPWPDLVVGAIVAVVAFKGGLEILADVRRDRRAALSAETPDGT